MVSAPVCGLTTFSYHRRVNKRQDLAPANPHEARKPKTLQTVVELARYLATVGPSKSMKPSNTPVVAEKSCLDKDTQKICPQSKSIHFESTLPSVLTRTSETKISLRLPTPYPSKILFSSDEEVDKSRAELSHSSLEKRACIQANAKPLEDLFDISEERIFEEVHQSMIKMQSEEQLLKGVSVEQVRKIVSLIHQKINSALSNYIKQQIFCQGPTWLELPSTSADSPGQLLATASINLIDTRWQDSAEMMELSLNLATETTDEDTDSVVKVALKTLEKFVDSSQKENKEAGQSENRARFNMFENFHFSKRDLKTMNEKNLEHKNQSITIVDVKSSNECDKKAESSEMVKTVPKHLESLCDSPESSLGKFDNSLPLTPGNCFTAESQLQPDNVQEKLESAIPVIFKYVEDKLKVFFRATEAQAAITPEKQKMKSPPLAGAVDKDMLDMKLKDVALCKTLSTRSDSPVSGASSESDRHSLHIQVSAGEVCPNFSEMLHISSEELLELEKKEALVSAAGLVAVTIVESLVDSTSVETHECENESHEESNSHFNTFLHVMAEKMKHYLKRAETSVQALSNDGDENAETSFGLQRQPSPKLSQDVLIKATLAVSDVLIPPSIHSHEDLLLAKQCQADKAIKSASQQPELSEMVKTVAENLENLFDSVEHSGFDLFEVPYMGGTQKSSSTADNLDPAVNHIFQDVKDKLKHFLTSSKVPASSQTTLYPLSEDAGEVFQDLPPLTPSADVLMESDGEKETDIITTTEMVAVAILESLMDSTSKENCKDEDKSQNATKARFNTFLHVLADKIKPPSKGVQETVDQEKKIGFENLPSTMSEDTRKECKSTSAETSQMSSEHNVFIAPQVQGLSLLTPSAVELDKEKESDVVLAAEMVSLTTVESFVDSTTKDVPRHEPKNHGAANVGLNTFLHACADQMKRPFKGIHANVDQQRKAANLISAPVEATVLSSGDGTTESSLSLAGQPSSELSRDVLMKATLAVSDLLDPSCSHPQQDQLLSQKGQEVSSTVTGRSTSQQAVVSGMVETVTKDLVNLFDSFERFDFDMFGPCFEEISTCSSANNCELGSKNCQSCFEPAIGHIFQSVTDKKSQLYNSSLKEDSYTHVRSNACDDLTEELIKSTSAEISSHLPSVGGVCIGETPSFLEKESLSGPSLNPKILPDPANHMADQSLVKSDLPCENVSMDKTKSEASLFYHNFWLSLIDKLTPRKLKPAVEVQQEAKSLLRNEDAAGPPPKHNWRRNQPDSMETEPDGNGFVGCQMVTGTLTHYIPSSSDIPATSYSSSYESVGTEDGGRHTTRGNTSTTPSSEGSLSYSSSLSSSSVLSERTARLKPGLDPTNVISCKRTNEVQATPGPSTENSKVEGAALETSAGTRDRSPRVRMVATELSMAVTAILCLMKRMLLIGEDPVKVEGDLEVLLSCGVLRPFRDSVVDRVNTFLLENAPKTELFLPFEDTTADDKIELSRETFLELVYTVTEHTFKDMFKHLIIMFLAPSSTHTPSETTDEIGSQTCSNACSKASKDIVSMFTRVVAQQVAETLSKDPIKSGQTEPSSLSKVSDDLRQRASLAPKNVLPPMPPSNHECLRSTLTILVVRIITKIRSVKSVVILKKMAAELTEQILKRCQDGTQLEKMEASLRDVNLMEITSNMKKALVREFSTLEALRRAMMSKDPAFGETLVTLLTDALLSCEDDGKELSLKPEEKVSYFSKLAQKRKMRIKVAPSPQQDPETMDCSAS